MSAINSETGESASTGKQSSRFTYWAALLIFSVVTLGASVEVKKELDSPTKASKWTIICSALSLCFSAIVIAFHLFPVYSPLLVGTKVEGALCLLMAIFWAATVSIVTNASNSLGVSVSGNSDSQELNGNLYYGSWAGFITAIILLIDYLREAFGVDVVGEVRNRAARLTLWSGFLAASLIVMGSASRAFSEECKANADTMMDTPYCRRTKFAVSIGSISVFFGLAIIGVKLLTTSAPFFIEFGSTIFLAVLNAFGVAYITSAKGPGSAIGNLYYSTWITFVTAALLAADCYKQFSGGNAGGSTDDYQPKEQSQNYNHNHNNDLPVEELSDDQI